jgi:GMP synthase PP-ATPase subunit
LGEIEEDENKLKNVNEQIKCTLTDLLNCEGVRGDGRYRMWVQTRLMDTEKQLTGSRSRTRNRRMEDVSRGMFQYSG